MDATRFELGQLLMGGDNLPPRRGLTEFFAHLYDLPSQADSLVQVEIEREHSLEATLQFGNV